MFASRFSWLMVVKEERRFTGRARVTVGLGPPMVVPLPANLLPASANRRADSVAGLLLLRPLEF